MAYTIVFFILGSTVHPGTGLNKRNKGDPITFAFIFMIMLIMLIIMTMIMIVHPNNHDPDDHDTYQARWLAVVHLFNDPIAVLFFNAAVTKS